MPLRESPDAFSLSLDTNLILWRGALKAPRTLMDQLHRVSDLEPPSWRREDRLSLLVHSWPAPEEKEAPTTYSPPCTNDHAWIFNFLFAELMITLSKLNPSVQAGQGIRHYRLRIEIHTIWWCSMAVSCLYEDLAPCCNGGNRSLMQRAAGNTRCLETTNICIDVIIAVLKNVKQVPALRCSGAQ